MNVPLVAAIDELETAFDELLGFVELLLGVASSFMSGKSEQEKRKHKVANAIFLRLFLICYLRCFLNEIENP
ncbi:hypothetical protein R83H12_02642 [Fibrobacteria bacterium R8-3-H12]